MKGERVNKTSQHYQDCFDDFNLYFPDEHVKVRCLNNDIDNGIIYPKDNTIYTVIVHIHGGGFLSMSSKTHTVHTKSMVAQTGVPIFSIDYRLAPENPFPAALEDCWGVYDWLINHGFHQMNLNPKKILVIGDSAGGNLVCGITTLAIINKMRVPDEIILIYPSLQLSMGIIVPSLLYSLTDPLITINFGKVTFEAYIDGHKSSKKDYIVNPLITPEIILKDYPKTRILVATKDVLRDEAYIFLHKMVESKVDVKLTELMNFPHGFLNYNTEKFGIKGAELGLDQIIQWINEGNNPMNSKI